MQQPSALSSFEGICCLVGFDHHRNVRIVELTDGNSNLAVLVQRVSSVFMVVSPDRREACWLFSSHLQ